MEIPGKYKITKNGIIAYHRHIAQDILGTRLSTTDLESRHYVEYLEGENPYSSGRILFISWDTIEKRIKKCL